MSDASESETSEEQAGGIAAVSELLKASRERSGQELRDVAQTLRIRYRYLEAIEAGDISDLPGKTYAIGFVRAYADHLGLDGEEMVRRFKGNMATAKSKDDLVFPSPVAESSIPGGAILFVGLVVAALGYGIWYFNSTDDDVAGDLVAPVPERLAELAPKPVAPAEDQTPASEPAAADEPAPEPVAVEETASEPTEEVLSAETQAPEPVPAPEVVEEDAATEVTTEIATEAVAEAGAEVADETPEEVATAPAAPDAAASASEGASRIEIRARINSWIQVRDDDAGRLLFTRLLRAGDSYHVPARSGLRLLTGNAGALEILVDGQSVPPIGGEGQVRRDVALDPDRLQAGTAVLDN